MLFEKPEYVPKKRTQRLTLSRKIFGSLHKLAHKSSTKMCHRFNKYILKQWIALLHLLARSDWLLQLGGIASATFNDLRAKIVIVDRNK